MKSYDERLRLGLCPQCGGRRDTHFIRCSKCNKYAREYARRHRGNSAKNAMAYRERNRLKGVCPTCGRSIDDPRYKRCSVCRARTLSYYRRDPVLIKLRRIELKELAMGGSAAMVL